MCMNKSFINTAILYKIIMCTDKKKRIIKTAMFHKNKNNVSQF